MASVFSAAAVGLFDIVDVVLPIASLFLFDHSPPLAACDTSVTPPPIVVPLREFSVDDLAI